MKKRRQQLDLGDGPTHRAKRPQPHLATEYAENGDPDSAQQLARRLRPLLRRRVLVVQRGG